jgi:alkyl sulfatase BDS1-like metallo-beta-lactamase superfamily hydrolase
MGYQAEGPQWRGIFLSAAKELREGAQPAPFTTASEDTILAMPLDILFDFAAVHVIGDAAAQIDISIDFTFTDLDETWNAWVRRGVLNARKGAGAGTPAQLTVSGPKPLIVAALLQPAAASKLADADKLTLDGDADVLSTLAGVIDTFDPSFDIVTP